MSPYKIVNIMSKLYILLFGLSKGVLLKSGLNFMKFGSFN